MNPKISRRCFHRRAVHAAAGGLAIGRLGAFCSAEPRRSGLALTPPASKYIDMHTHLGQPWSPRGPLPADVMLRWMDEHDIAQAVALPLISPEAWYYPISTDWVLQEVPGSDFIGHAPGFWASISGDASQADLGGYPKGPVTPGGALDRLMEKYPNLYGEFSAGSGANSIRRDQEFGREFLIRRADRLLFGTDYLAVGQEIPQFELFESFDLPEDVKAKIFRENARRVLASSAA